MPKRGFRRFRAQKNLLGKKVDEGTDELTNLLVVDDAVGI